MCQNERLPLPDTPNRALTAAEFQSLADVPRNWNGSNLTNAKTRCAYQFDARDPTRFVGIVRPEDFQIVTHAHPVAWRQAMKVRKLAPSTIRRKFSTLLSLFDYLCEHSAVPHNPVDGIKQPQTLNNDFVCPGEYGHFSCIGPTHNFGHVSLTTMVFVDLLRSIELCLINSTRN